MNDLRNYTNLVDNKLSDVAIVQAKNKLSPVFAKFQTLQDQTKDIKENTINATIVNNGTADLIEKILINLRNIDIATDGLLPKNKDSDSIHLPALEEAYTNLESLLSKSNAHSSKLQDTESDLNYRLSGIESNSAQAIKAAKAYENIENAVNSARQMALNATSAAKSATELTEGIEDKAYDSNKKSQELLTLVREQLNNITRDLQPKLNISKESVQNVRQLNSWSDDENTATIA